MYRDIHVAEDINLQGIKEKKDFNLKFKAQTDRQTPSHTHATKH